MNDLLAKDKENIWHPFTPLEGAPEPLLITNASGLYLHTHDGRKIMDVISSWYVNLHGHANPLLAAAISEQALKLEHVIFAGFTHEPAIRLSENLLSFLPKTHNKIFYSDNGSTAVEVGLKIAFQYWYNQGIKKTKAIAIQGAYHGDTFGSMSVGDRGLFTNPWSPYLFETGFINFPTDENKDQVIEEFKDLVSVGDIGVFIYEPLIQASAGMRVYSSQILQKLLDHAKEHDVICIADEVFTGFGRTGKMLAGDYLSTSPDIICLSKGLTGGALPLGATSCSGKIVDIFTTPDFSKTFFHGHSYTANPLACTAANKSFEILQSEECQQSIRDIEASHQAFNKKIKGKYKALKDIRILGTMIAFELRVDETKYDHQIRNTIYNFFMDRNILMRPLGNIFYLLPPYVISVDELKKVYQTIEEFLLTLK